MRIQFIKFALLHPLRGKSCDISRPGKNVLKLAPSKATSNTEEEVSDRRDFNHLRPRRLLEKRLLSVWGLRTWDARSLFSRKCLQLETAALSGSRNSPSLVVATCSMSVNNTSSLCKCCCLLLRKFHIRLVI